MVSQTPCVESRRRTQRENDADAMPDARAISCVPHLPIRAASDAVHAERRLHALRRTVREHSQSVRRLCPGTPPRARAVRHLRSEYPTSREHVRRMRDPASTGRPHDLCRRLCLTSGLPRRTIEVSSGLARRTYARRSAPTRRRWRVRRGLARPGPNLTCAAAQARVQPSVGNRTGVEQEQWRTDHAEGTSATSCRDRTIVAAQYSRQARKRRGGVRGACLPRWPRRNH